MMEKKKIPLLNVLRQKFLYYYAERGHEVIPSANLVPENDSTTLFTSSGMQPLVPYLLGEKHPKGKRVCDSQKCFRSNDIEEVGDARHTTFFEMLGNWSLGDYFKKEQIEWVWKFLVEEVGLVPERIYVTVFGGNSELRIGRDEEAVEIWKGLMEKAGVSNGVEWEGSLGLGDGKRIFGYGEEKNWWSRSGIPEKMPAGEPGGPDSEIFYDFGAELGLHESSEWKDLPCHVNCDCGRFVEIGNSVFMQYIKQKDDGFGELPQKNVDYGGGVERLVMAVEDQQDIFLTSSFLGIVEAIEAESGLKYDEVSEEQRAAMRVIADHIRATVMLMADGVVPSNKEQGYVLRRLIRRAIRKARILGVTESGLLEKIATEVISFYGDFYQNVKAKKVEILKELHQEEVKFGKMIDKGLKEIEKMEQMDGAMAFRLYESFGFPFELTAEIATEKGWQVSEEEFLVAQKAHQEQSRAGAEAKFAGGLADAEERTVKFHTATHLLHQALRQILGEEVRQMGSNITAERARFDFSFDRALTEEEKTTVVELVNGWIEADLEVKCEKMAKEEAIMSGALHFFVEKYPDEVSVYSVEKTEVIDDGGKEVVSKEICMGPHVERTGEIGKVKIVKEKASSKGVRRIYLELD